MKRPLSRKNREVPAPPPIEPAEAALVQEMLNPWRAPKLEDDSTQRSEGVRVEAELARRAFEAKRNV